MPVLNKHKDRIPPDAIYIGRGSRWGNPFVIGKHGDRAAVCSQYKELLWNQIKENKVSLQDLAALKGKSLVCFCAPLSCHGHVLESAALWAHNQLENQ